MSAGLFHLVRNDCVNQLRLMADESVDLMIFDPAYESLEKHRAKGTTTRLKQSAASSNVWFEIFRNARFPELFTECFRVLKKNAHLYVYCDLDTAKVIDPMGEEAGFKLWNWIVWDKMKIGMGYHYRRRKEFILFFEKGKRKLNSLGIPDVLDGLAPEFAERLLVLAKRVVDDTLSGDVAGVDAQELAERVLWTASDRGVDIIAEPRVDGGYPTEKPVAVSQILVRQSSAPGEVVLDCFMGSGSVGEAALLEGRGFIGIDTAELSHEVAGDRLDRLGKETDALVIPRAQEGLKLL